MKAQLNKCHTFSVLLFNRISFHYICSVRVNVLILNYATISRSFGVLLYAVTHGSKFPKSSPHKFFLARES